MQALEAIRLWSRNVILHLFTEGWILTGQNIEDLIPLGSQILNVLKK